MTADHSNGISGVCAWCRSTYDRDTGNRLRKLTDAEYTAVLSHGVCKRCSQAEIAAYAAARALTPAPQRHTITGTGRKQPSQNARKENSMGASQRDMLKSGMDPDNETLLRQAVAFIRKVFDNITEDIGSDGQYDNAADD